MPPTPCHRQGQKTLIGRQLVGIPFLSGCAHLRVSEHLQALAKDDDAVRRMQHAAQQVPVPAGDQTSAQQKQTEQQQP